MAISFDTFRELYSRIKKGDFESDRKLAKEYGVNRNCLYQIRQRKHKYFEILGESEDPNEAIVFPAVLEETTPVKTERCRKCGNSGEAGIPCFECSIREYKDKKVRELLDRLEPDRPGRQ